MSVVFAQAGKDDIDELIRLRLAYMNDDFGSVSEHEKSCMETQLKDYFARKLGTELIAFVARDNEKLVAVAYLLVVEMPANSGLLSGLYGVVMNVFTEPEYRGQGICTKLLQNLIEYGKSRGLGRIELSATENGYPIYKKLGFTEKNTKYKDMRLSF
jgi:ribosomal protein S18 acetylase RimI-like enzyme